MAYTNTQKADVTSVIENYTSDYLDRYVQADVVKEALNAMSENKTNIQVADSVFDYLYTNNKGTPIEYTSLKNNMPKDIMLIVRNEIIKALS